MYFYIVVMVDGFYPAYVVFGGAVFVIGYHMVLVGC